MSVLVILLLSTLLNTVCDLVVIHFSKRESVARSPTVTLFISLEGVITTVRD